jgi:hypothetical protein
MVCESYGLATNAYYLGPTQRAATLNHSFGALQALPTPTTTMWSPIHTTIGFYSPRFNALQPNGHSIHANSCCLANYNQRTHCQQYDNNYANHQNLNNCLINSFESTNLRNTNISVNDLNNLNEENDENQSIHESIHESIHVSQVNDSKQCNSTEKVEDLRIKQLKAINQMLKSSLEQTTNKLKETQNMLLNVNQVIH